MPSTRGLGDTFYVQFLTEQYDKERGTRLNMFENQKTKPATRSKVSDVMKKRVQDGTPKPIGQLLTVKDLPPADYRKKKFKYPAPEKYLTESRGFQLGDEREDPRRKHRFTPKKPDREGDPMANIANLARLPTMMPASADVKQRLYEGISHHGQGRYRYLSDRYKEHPEEKFPFPQLISWDYGWRLGDVMDPMTMTKSPYTRVGVIRDTFYRRNGLPGLPISACF